MKEKWKDEYIHLRGNSTIKKKRFVGFYHIDDLKANLIDIFEKHPDIETLQDVNTGKNYTLNEIKIL